MSVIKQTILTDDEQEKRNEISKSVKTVKKFIFISVREDGTAAIETSSMSSKEFAMLFADAAIAVEELLFQPLPTVIYSGLDPNSPPN